MKGTMKNLWFKYGGTVKSMIYTFGIGILCGCLYDAGHDDGVRFTSGVKND